MVKEFTDNNHNANQDTQKVAAVIVSTGSVAVIAEALWASNGDVSVCFF